jgi:hypothetical protein
MSRAAGTLITTYNATHIAPTMLPGLVFKSFSEFNLNLYFISYGGHVPTLGSQYGETYGHSTEKYFHDYRNEVLNSSKSLYTRGKSSLII